MKNLLLVGLIVALCAAAGCQPKKSEPMTQIYPPDSTGLEPIDGLAAPSGTAAEMPEPIIQPPMPAGQMDTYSAPAQRVHTVVKGDTLWGIARKYYGTASRERVQKIVDANPGINPDRIFVGQKIIVP